MDDEQTPKQVIAAEYRFLAKFNRVTAGARSLLNVIDRRLDAPPQQLHVVECGSGGGDIARSFMRLAAGRPWSCRWLCTDASQGAIDFAREQPIVEGISFQRADVRSVDSELGPSSADVVHASLVLHHLDEEDVVRALCAMSRVARRLVVWNDLIRDRAGIVGAHLSSLLTRKAVRRDAVLSVRRSFTMDEARTLAEAAGLQDIWVERVRGARLVLSARPAAPGLPVRPRPMARAEHVGFSFDTRTVFSGVSFVARSGEIVEVTGPNGSGKSTLLACLAGALPVRVGRTWVDRTSSVPGYVPQNGGLLSALSASANLELAARLSGVHRRERESRVRDTIELFGLTDHAHKSVQLMSGGVKRRTEIACAFVHEPSVVILDEPETGLDASGLEALNRVLTRVIVVGGIAIIASHNREWLSHVHDSSRRVRVAL
jgi:energy-coupling factor transporter ATP-binding protein EcfA2/ubiquinone/menaquinone biosynthesis C-methylase UbiE